MARRMARTLIVDYWGGQDHWADAGQYDIQGGVLMLYHVETKKILVAYGAHQWIRAKWTHNDGDDDAHIDGGENAAP